MSYDENWRNFQLYAITAPSCHPGKSVVQVMEQALRGGAQILQLRNKSGSREEVLEQAKSLRVLTRAYRVPFIINDYPDIALEVEADGVHLGQDDMTIHEARRLLGKGRIIGISTHNIGQAVKAEQDGADYIGVGPVYPTNTKPGRAAVTTSFVAEAASRISIPFVAIGGITPDNVDEVLAAGAKRICAVSAIVGSNDPEAVCRKFHQRIQMAADAASSGEQSMRRIIVNGQERVTAAATVEQLVQSLGQYNKRLVAELDGVLIQRAAWAETKLEDGISIELIHFVGGG